MGQARGRIAATASSAALAGHSGLACIRISAAAAVERDTPARQVDQPDHCTDILAESRKSRRRRWRGCLSPRERPEGGGFAWQNSCTLDVVKNGASTSNRRSVVQAQFEPRQIARVVVVNTVRTPAHRNNVAATIEYRESVAVF